MKVLVVRVDENKLLKQLSEAIAEGVRAAGDYPVVASAGEAGAGDVSSFELVFIGFTVLGPLGFKGRTSTELKQFVKQAGLGGKKIAVYCTYSGKPNKETIGGIMEELSKAGARIVNSLGIRVKKEFFGAEEVTETDLIRARGFGERTTNNAKGASVARDNEKRRIKRYLK